MYVEEGVKFLALREGRKKKADIGRQIHELFLHRVLVPQVRRGGLKRDEREGRKRERRRRTGGRRPRGRSARTASRAVGFGRTSLYAAHSAAAALRIWISFFCTVQDQQQSTTQTEDDYGLEHEGRGSVRGVLQGGE